MSVTAGVQFQHGCRYAAAPAPTLVETSVPAADERAAGVSIAAGKRERPVAGFFPHGPYRRCY